MLGTKEELGRDAFAEMYVYLQPVAKPSCSTLPDVPLYFKSGHLVSCLCHRPISLTS